MRFCYAFRRFSDFPNLENAFDMHPEKISDKFLKRVKDMGFDGIELGMECLDRVNGGIDGLKEFSDKFNNSGVPILAIRAGGLLIDPKSGNETFDRVLRAIKFAEILGSEVINGAISLPNKSPYLNTGSKLIMSSSSTPMGFSYSQNSSRETTLPEYEMLASKYKNICKSAKNSGLKISCEVHQNSPVDNSWSAKLLYDMVEDENFGINPDLGNILWNYDTPEETCEDAIKELAPISNYWHCKNLVRVNHPENQRSVFLRETILSGEIDYRFSIEAMHQSNYSGLMALEGVFAGDQFYSDRLSLNYCKELWSELEN